MKTLIKIACIFMPNSILKFFIKHKYLTQHQYPVSTLIHRKKAKVIFEIEFNWFDDNLDPVSLVREVQSGKTYSVGHYDMYDFKEFEGKDRSIGNTI